MPELKPKVILAGKGDEAFISVKQLMVTLRWRSAVDLDLMAFYKTKDGRVGGVFSDNYTGGSLGSLNSFPFIQLSGDEGVGAKGGASEETLCITKLDDMAEVWICTLNFTDAVANRPTTFSNYDAEVVVVDDKGESVGVPLNSSAPGTVAVIAKIDNSGFMGAKMINVNQVMDMATFQRTVPGATQLNIASKIVLRKTGDSIELQKKSAGGFGEVLVNLNWNQGAQAQQHGGLLGSLHGGSSGAIDLDLGCLFELTNGQKGTVQALGDALGSYNTPPYINLEGDDRTGASKTGENLHINGNQAPQIKRVLVYAFIYEGVARWSQTDAVVTISQPGSPEIVINVDEHRDGQIMCALALVERNGDTLSLSRQVRYFSGHEEMDHAYHWGMRWVAGRK
ncbi:MAG: TerD family protein [Armatimonadota bacterium]